MSEHHVVFKTLCRCAQKAGIARIVTCDDRNEAYETALALASRCNDTFCGKHGFDVVEVGSHYVIAVEQGGFVEACEI